MTKKYELKKYERKREIIIFGAAVAAAVAIALFFSVCLLLLFVLLFCSDRGDFVCTWIEFFTFFFVFLFQLRLITLYCLQWTFFFSQQYKFKLLFVFQLYADVFVVDLSLACCLRA